MSAPSSSFGGDLALVGLFDLSQLLVLNRATGCLALSNDAARGYLWFEDGRIVNAMDDARREGEAAAYRVFTWKSGEFEFRPEPPGGAQTITCGAEALMLEAARLMDEAGEAAGRLGVETEKLREHRGAMEALREAFDSFAREARSAPEDRVAEISGPPLDALTRPGDRLVLRPGRPARLRLFGEWREARDAALSAADYAEIKSRLMPGGGGPEGDTRPRAPDRSAAVILGDRVLDVACVSGGAQEALWIRPTALAAPDPARIEGPLARLHEILDAEGGVVLFSGPDPDTASQLIHAVVASLMPDHNASLLLASDLLTYRHEEGAGVVIETAMTHLAASLRALAPETLVIDDGGALPAGALAGADSLQRVLVRVTAAEADRALPEWLARLAEPDRRRLEVHFGPAPRALALAHPVASGDERIPFTLCRYEDESRLTTVSFQTSEPAARSAGGVAQRLGRG